MKRTYLKIIVLSLLLVYVASLASALVQPKAYSSSYWECNNGFSQTRNSSTGFNYCWDVRNIEIHANYACKENGGIKTLSYSKECTPTNPYQEKCIDSDGRLDLYEKSNYLFGYVNAEEYCWDGEKTVSSGKMVGEVWCNQDGSADFGFFTCKNGCENGACKEKVDDDNDGNGGNGRKTKVGECQVGDCENPYPERAASLIVYSDGGQNNLEYSDVVKKKSYLTGDIWSRWLFWIIIGLIVLIILIMIVAILKR